MNEPININEASFEKAVLQSPIARAGRFLGAMVRAVQDDRAAPRRNRERKRDGRFRVAKVNIDDDPALMQRFGIRGVPTLLFFSGGELKDQIVGGAPKQAILEKLSHLSGSTTSA